MVAARKDQVGVKVWGLREQGEPGGAVMTLVVVVVEDVEAMVVGSTGGRVVMVVVVSPESESESD